MKRWLILGLIVLVLSSIVIAQTEEEQTASVSFDEEKSYTWLKDSVGNWGEINEISSISLSMLALINHGEDVSSGVSRLNSLKSSTGCWPSSGCNALDTAFASLALYKAGYDVSDSVAWLEDKNAALNPALSNNKWFIDIITEGTGECTLKYGSGQEKKVKITGGVITGGKINVGTLVDLNKVGQEITVDCGNLPTGMTLELTYEPTATNFYILDWEKANAATFRVDNGCYGTSATSSGCDYLTTGYATWALTEMGREPLTRIYLESQIAQGDVLQHALVGRITGKSDYLKFLEDNQGSDGSWSGGYVYTTSWAIFALSKSPPAGYQRGLEFLERVVAANGHWNSNVKDTSMALIAIHGKDLSGASGGIIPQATCASDNDCLVGEICNLTTSKCEAFLSGGEICDNTIDDDADGLIDCYDSECVNDPSCISSETECSVDSDCAGYGMDYICDLTLGRCVTQIMCNADGICDSGEGCDCEDCASDSQCAETTSGCTSDKDCLSSEKCDTKTGECVTKKGIPWWILIVLLVLLALGGGGWWLVKSGKIDLQTLFKKKPSAPKQPSFIEYAKERPIQPGFTSQRTSSPSSNRTKEDVELEKSLREAEKILHGK